MAEINYIIPEQRFEIVRDKIVSILESEFARQDELLVADGKDPYGVTVFKERFIPYQTVELPAVSVIFNKSTYEDGDWTANASDSQYIIDIKTDASDTEDGRGDTDASLLLHRLIGVVRQIFESGEYRFLGFSPGERFINKTKVDQILIGAPDSDGDSNHNISGRVTFTANFVEINDSLPTTPLEKAVADFTPEGENEDSIGTEVPQQT